MRGVVGGLALVLALVFGVALVPPADAALVCLDGSGGEVAPGGDDGVLVCYEAMALGGGLTSYNILIDPNTSSAADTGSLAILIEFAGALNQILGFGNVIDEDGDAQVANDFDAAYEAAFDSFYFTDDVWTTLNPFPDRVPPVGIRGGEDGSMLYQFSAGTGTGYGNGVTAPLAQIVARGPIQFDGTVGFMGQDMSVGGEIPEPATAGLMALGLFGLGLQARRWRR